jgi:hypothetical protein
VRLNNEAGIKPETVQTNDVTSRVVTSIHARKNRTGSTYRVLWREDGRRRSLTFENLPAAERFKTYACAGSATVSGSSLGGRGGCGIRK